MLGALRLHGRFPETPELVALATKLLSDLENSDAVYASQLASLIPSDVPTELFVTVRVHVAQFVGYNPFLFVFSHSSSRFVFLFKIKDTNDLQCICVPDKHV